MSGSGADPVVDLRLDRAHSARMYDWYLGGHTNFAADREAAGKVLAVYPAARTAARLTRQLTHRVTRFLAREGMRQFLDIGTGIPTPPNLHEVAQEVRPEARVVYVDNDPIVLAHAAALLRSHTAGRTAYVQADATVPESVLRAPLLHATLDLGEPVALSLNALLHFVTDDGCDRAHAIVECFKSAVPSGSTLAMTHATADLTPTEMARITEIYVRAGTPFQSRSKAEFTRFFDGWELVEPGVVLSHAWRPDGPAEPLPPGADVCYAAVARKP
ncbi:SAM-dependent methyltransferase [Streptomyces gamaensis]|uniref:SAM-dependent methyltransferase n=1 Tax=Streptomyces gamaensis TaxID=1763542 RepID=A0ABW0Z306_9ACTN